MLEEQNHESVIMPVQKKKIKLRKNNPDVRFYLERVCVVIASLNFAEGGACWLFISVYTYTAWLLYAPVLSKLYIVVSKCPPQIVINWIE